MVREEWKGRVRSRIEARTSGGSLSSIAEMRRGTRRGRTRGGIGRSGRGAVVSSRACAGLFVRGGAARREGMSGEPNVTFRERLFYANTKALVAETDPSFDINSIFDTILLFDASSELSRSESNAEK
jgi:hypothetical protein